MGPKHFAEGGPAIECRGRMSDETKEPSADNPKENPTEEQTPSDTKKKKDKEKVKKKLARGGRGRIQTGQDALDQLTG